MPAEYEIVAVENDGQYREWKGGGGSTFHAFRVTLKNSQGAQLPNVEMNKKPGNVPSVGDSIYGEVDREAKFGPKFKSAQRPGGGSYAQGGSANGSVRSDDRGDSIEAQVAAKVAGLIVASGQAPVGQLRTLTVEAFASIQAAKGGGESTPFPPTASGWSDTPADTSDFQDDGKQAEPDPAF